MFETTESHNNKRRSTVPRLIHKFKLSIKKLNHKNKLVYGLEMRLDQKAFFQREDSKKYNKEEEKNSNAVTDQTNTKKKTFKT